MAVALKDYYLLLLTSPSFADSLSLSLQSTRLYACYSYLWSLFYSDHTLLYHILSRARTEESLRAWRIERAVLTSDRLQNERNLLFDASLANDLEHISTLANLLSNNKQEETSASYQRLKVALSVLTSLYSFRAEIVQRAEEVHQTGSDIHEADLRTLWRNLKPDTELASLVTKQWQDLGFQGTSPSTDFRSTGCLGLDQLLHVSHVSSSRAQRLIAESVEGGAAWYPLAIVSIAMTDFLLTQLKTSNLTLYLLQASKPPSSTSFKAHFHALHTSLLYTFHEHWLHLVQTLPEGDKPTVMAFERIFAKWRIETVRWLKRGIVGGWWDSRGFCRVDVGLMGQVREFVDQVEDRKDSASEVNLVDL